MEFNGIQFLLGIHEIPIRFLLVLKVKLTCGGNVMMYVCIMCVMDVKNDLIKAVSVQDLICFVLTLHYEKQPC